MQKENSFFPLEGTIQHYSWGGMQFIAQLKGLDNPGQQPFAEYWMGAHEQSPSQLPQNSIDLSRFIASDPARILGKRVYNAFGRLPYLLKVLDVKDMLSIQVHPTKKYAETAYLEEESKGVSITSSRRNYKDQNHKPELMFALSEFYLLHGFKSSQLLQQTLREVPELSFLLPDWQKGGHRAIFQKVMEMSQHDVQKHLKPLADRILPLYDNFKLSKDDPSYWAARAYKTYCSDGVMDRGLFSIYFLNLLHLSPGQVIFQDAGLLHAYLEGQNIELMANSDNVLRGGLTNKHIDVGELMKNVDFRPVVPRIIKPVKGAIPPERLYPTPAADFELHEYNFAAGSRESVNSDTADIYIIMEGSVQVNDEIRSLLLNRGDALFTIAGAYISIQCLEKARLFRATVPSSTK
jgi:mannose-6-phosphate isomerase